MPKSFKGERTTSNGIDIHVAVSGCSLKASPIATNTGWQAVLISLQVRRRMQTSGCLAVMAGRGALIKPWIFWEHREGCELNPSAQDRVEIYRRLVGFMKEHFGDDARGRQKAWNFLPWHFDFFHRYRCAGTPRTGKFASKRSLSHAKVWPASILQGNGHF